MVVKDMLVYQKANNMTPKELMISRYQSFTHKNWSYLVETSISQTFQELSVPSSIEWLKLEVLDEYENIVEFKAYFREHGIVSVLHEKSYFTLVDGVWKYKDGEIYNTKIERNEICPCGSGKKFKRCCGY